MNKEMNRQMAIQQLKKLASHPKKKAEKESIVLSLFFASKEWKEAETVALIRPLDFEFDTDKIAKKVRHIGGGLRFVKGIGLKLEDRNQTQVSMNLVNFEKSSVYQAFEMVKMEAKRYGVNVVGSEVIGTVPMKSLLDAAEYYLQIENFSIEQILEKKLLDEK